MVRLVRRRIRGTAMLEVLIAALVIGFILLALVHFQGTLTQTNNYAKTRSLAVSLAQAKLDDLRSFSQLAGGPAGTFGYSEIAANAGGREKVDGTLELPSGVRTVANVAYTVTWTCSERSYTAGVLGAAVSPCTASTTTDFKDVVVTVNWLEPLTGVTETVTLNTVIHADDAAKGAKSIVESAKSTPMIAYTPGSGPGYVPVPITPDVNQESSQPLPDTVRNEVTTETSFDAVQYLTSDLGSLSRREFLTVNCTCEQAGVGLGRAPTRPPLPDLYGRTNLQTGIGAFVSKRVGIAKTGGAFNAQPDICKTCCRDHHDTTSVALKYDPFNGSPAGPGGDHDHYNRNNAGVLVLANNLNDTYIEACRFQRVNGVFELVQDWKLENLVLLPDSYFSTYRNSYTAYVDQFIRDYINGINIGLYPTTTPIPSTVLANAPTELLMGINMNRPVQTRAIYIDYMLDTEITDLKSKLAMDSDAVILPYVPWTEVNVTRLANWSVDNPSKISVTNEPILDRSEQDYSRGVVRSLSGTPSAPFPFVRASIERSNSGLSDSFAVDPADSAYLNRQLTVRVSASAAPPSTYMVSGSITISGAAGSDVQASDVVVVGLNGASCTKGITPDIYTCNLSSAGTGTVEFRNYQGALVDGVTMAPIPPNQICPGASFNYSSVTASVMLNVAVVDHTETCP